MYIIEEIVAVHSMILSKACSFHLNAHAAALMSTGCICFASTGQLNQIILLCGHVKYVTKHNSLCKKNSELLAVTVC